jgi:hypothetical protein
MTGEDTHSNKNIKVGKMGKCGKFVGSEQFPSFTKQNKTKFR